MFRRSKKIICLLNLVSSLITAWGCGNIVISIRSLPLPTTDLKVETVVKLYKIVYYTKTKTNTNLKSVK